jgi:hypothetical protein
MNKSKPTYISNIKLPGDVFAVKMNNPLILAKRRNPGGCFVFVILFFSFMFFNVVVSLLLSDLFIALLFIVTFFAVFFYPFYRVMNAIFGKQIITIKKDEIISFDGIWDIGKKVRFKINKVKHVHVKGLDVKIYLDQSNSLVKFTEELHFITCLSSNDAVAWKKILVVKIEESTNNLYTLKEYEPPLGYENDKVSSKPDDEIDLSEHLIS